MGCFSGRLMSAASDQKLFCKLCLPFCCSFHEFVEEKVISPSYSSAILTPRVPSSIFKKENDILSQQVQNLELCLGALSSSSSLGRRKGPFVLFHGVAPLVCFVPFACLAFRVPQGPSQRQFLFKPWPWDRYLALTGGDPGEEAELAKLWPGDPF